VAFKPGGCGKEEAAEDGRDGGDDADDGVEHGYVGRALLARGEADRERERRDKEAGVDDPVEKPEPRERVGEVAAGGDHQRDGRQRLEANTER
jgi:hypothetical protein